MNPPAEQLIRDYLNRLSLAARSRLAPGDRQGLLDHTRARIDAECGGITNPSAAQVRRTLAGLGDPMALVEKERSRLAARKAWDDSAAQANQRESRFESRASGSLRQVWPPPASPVRARRPLMPPVILPAATANVQVSAVRPVTAAAPQLAESQPVLLGSAAPSHAPAGCSPSAPAGSLMPASTYPTGANRVPLANAGVPVDPPTARTPAGPAVPCEPVRPPVLASAAAAENGPPDGAKPARPTSPTEPRGLPPARGVPRPRGIPPGRETPSSGAVPAPPGGAGTGAGSSAGKNGLSPRPPAPRPAPESAAPSSAAPPQAQPARSGAASGGQPADDVPGVDLSVDQIDIEVEPSRLAEVRAALVRWLRVVGTALLAIARRDRLEAITVLLLGIGGAIFPPIWLVGAMMAVASKKWDLRDKWLGLVVPVLAVILGATLAVTFGAQQSSYTSYLVEGWVAASRLSRVAAVLSAVYLLWRVYKYRGSRATRLPPWSPQRKPGR